MNIAIIGEYFEYGNIKCIEFSSSDSFLDYDIIFIDFKCILYEYRASTNSNGNFQGYKCLDDDDSVKLLNDIKRRKFEINELLRLGRTIVVSNFYETICYVDSGKREFSGTGINTRTTRIVEPVNLLIILPLDISTFPSSGRNIEFKGEEFFSSFWKINKNHVIYTAYFEEIVGKPIFYIKGTDKVIGSWLNIENGNLLFLPFINEDIENEKIKKDYFNSLISLVSGLKKDFGDFSIPPWGEEYLLPKEKEAKEKQRKYDKELEKINDKISKHKQLFAQINEFKILFTGSGKALELQVSKIFKMLGFKSFECESGRDDLILEYDEKIIVVEIKGVSKSAAEKHATQLEKWVSEYYNSKEIHPKGLLIVNAFKDVPLKDRIENPFPDQMIDYSKKRDHCLITGIQLLGLYLFCIENPDKKEEEINKLFTTIGVYDEYKDWRKYIVISENDKINQLQQDN